MADLSRFRGIGRGNGAEPSKPTDPEGIFRRAPKRPDSFADLWRGQTDALRGWNARRDRPDILITLNTGAGKTVIGGLIAQSFVNEGLRNVIYACGTIDLVRQTEKEARRLGLEPTTRTHGSFSDNRFQTGDSFCITTYQAIYHPFSPFQKALQPEALIFDDAHTSEGYLRDAYTFTIERRRHPAAIAELLKIVEPAFQEINRGEALRDLSDDERSSSILLVPPYFVYTRRDQITGVVREISRGKDNEDMRFKWGAIADHIQHCAITISRNVIEISPPFLPITTLPYFSSNNIRRVYLSATINYKSDLIRCCGREIADEDVIAPKNDAGEGERLVLFSSMLKTGQLETDDVKGIIGRHKAVISVPSYPAAKRWESLGTPPKPEDFSKELDTFRQRKSGAFILVYRLDGIDLPDDVCRIMIIDGMPTGSSQLERYQWQFLSMQNAYAAKIASRITQVFGRINRGTRDFSVHIIEGRMLNNWLSSDRNLALMSPLLRNQIKLGYELQQQVRINSVKEFGGMVTKVLSRDPEWLSIYGREILEKELDPTERDRSENVEKKMVTAAKAEIAFAEALWDNRYNDARNALDTVVADVGRGDSRLSGWFNVWIGYCYDAAGDSAAAQLEYLRAKQKLGHTIPLPKGAIAGPGYDLNTPFQEKMRALLLCTPEAYGRQQRLYAAGVRALFEAGGSAFDKEEAVRHLGENLGFDSSRPDNEGLGGPDVIWVDHSSNQIIGFELKTEKGLAASYTVDEVSKCHSYIEWIRQNYIEKLMGLIVVGAKSSLTQRATPSDEMYLCGVVEIASIATDFQRFMQETWGYTPSNRVGPIKRAEAETFGLGQLFRRLSGTKLNSLPVARR